MPEPSTDLSRFAAEQYCYLTTTGRRTGNPHSIEIWFAVDRGVVYMMSGGGSYSDGSGPRADWVRNLQATPAVRLRIGDHEWTARARVVEPGTEEDARVRPLLRDKYATTDDGLVEWARTALPVALEVDGESGA